MKLYIYNAVDLNTRWGFSYGFRSSSSRNAVEFMKKLESVLSYKGCIHTVKTDNGSEYLYLSMLPQDKQVY